MKAPCRTLVTIEEVLGTSREHPPNEIPWEAVCDEVVCITSKGGRRRWPHLKKSLVDADLFRVATLLFNDRPCDRSGETCEILDAATASHFFLIEKARREGLQRVLILEDDFYFDVSALPRAIEACSAFLALRLPFSAFLFGGVYTEMTATDVPLIFHGRGVQAHAWLVNVQHAAWGTLDDNGFRMCDVYNHERGDTYMVYPDVAFQKDFATGEQKQNRPTYNLAEFPLLYRVLTKIGMRFGMQNCWEGCARKTNAVVRRTGSIKVAVIILGTFVALLTVALLAVSCSWIASAKRLKQVVP
jgi:hypothetical protein